MMGRLGLYLKSTEAIDSDNDAIQKVARELTQDCTSLPERASRLFYFVRDSIKYNLFLISVYPEDFKASRVLEWGMGYCVQKAVLLAALGRATGIPTRLAFAKIKNHRVPPELKERLGTDIFPRHGYDQLYLEDRWVSVAATFDRELCQRHGLSTVEFNGVDDAVLPDKDLSGNPYIEYLQMYKPRADLPLQWITQATSRIWGSDKRPWLSETQAKGW